jgi:peptidoglycan hydrolase-like protein with peptidoglycan-binding domain
MSRGHVETAQWGLRRRGINVPADGNLDPRTQRALAEFQRDNGLPVTGIPDSATMSRLGATR